MTQIIETFRKDGSLKKRTTTHSFDNNTKSNKVELIKHQEKEPEFETLREAIENGVRDYRTLAKDYKANFNTIKKELSNHDYYNRSFPTIEEAIVKNGVKDIQLLIDTYNKTPDQVRDAFQKVEDAKLRLRKISNSSYHLDDPDNTMNELNFPTFFDEKDEDDKVRISKMLYSNGDIRKELPTKNGVIHGVVKSYYTGGAIEFETPYVNGLKHGLQQWHDISGGVKKTIKYEEGIKQ